MACVNHNESLDVIDLNAFSNRRCFSFGTTFMKRNHANSQCLTLDDLLYICDWNIHSLGEKRNQCLVDETATQKKYQKLLGGRGLRTHTSHGAWKNIQSAETGL
ncbi:unnamed protein product [Albugo candida]|uniref:Uncharacterized protein n=1 Tax=Albugo candida TaxID=65357 RepID=A0A024GET3_9STRA|nr:unnamed protein product [Albugo candida]|eukprot:CCI45025.1 unnamed protein product [Albugo candida]